MLRPCGQMARGNPQELDADTSVHLDRRPCDMLLGAPPPLEAERGPWGPPSAPGPAASGGPGRGGAGPPCAWEQISPKPGPGLSSETKSL